jgi:hypothetical protein
MIFYFIATRPYIEKAVGNKMYLSLEDASQALSFFNDLLLCGYQVFQAEATNIVLVEGAE